MLFQALAGNNARAQFGQLALAERGKKPVEVMGYDQLKNRVTEKLQPLVVEMEGLPLEGKTRVGQGLGQQEGIAELVADALLERIGGRSFLRG